VSNALPLGEYLVGVAELAAISIALGFAALRVRAWLVPAWSGAPARLAEAIVWLALLISVAELLGAFGVLEELPLVGACIALGVAVGLLAGARASRAGEGPYPVPPRPPPGRVAIIAGAIAVVAVAAAWAVPTAASFAEGIDGVDSMWYHLPQSARFAQTGSVVDLHFTDPYFTNWFYPAHSELLHALGMLAFERDLLSPLVNHAFLALGLLGAWCIGRPWGVGPQAMIGAAVVFAMEMTLDFQAGEARNDAAGVALFLAAAGLLVNARSARPGLAESRTDAFVPRHRGLAAFALAGLAAGLALGTKLTLIAPVAALSLGAVALAPRGWRISVGASWLAAVIVGGGFWYARNAAYSGGNPLPWVGELGPITLPAPEQAVELRPPFSVSHYLGDSSVWREWFVPGLGDAIGPLWPASLALVGLAAALALWFGGAALRSVATRRVATRPFEGRSARGFGGSVPPHVGAEGGLLAVLGGVVAVTVVAYVFTPLTASGEEGAPVGFAWNLRYLAPALALGLALLPALPPLRRPPWLGLTLFVLLGLALAQVATLDVWELGRWRVWALASAVAVLAAVGLAFWLRERRPLPRPVLALGALAACAAAVAGGYALQRDYLENRYADIRDAYHLDGPIAWANDLSDLEVATAGRGGVFFQYGFYGDELSNRVQWLGTESENGAWLPLRSCPDWRAAVNAGGYDYVVTTWDEAVPGDDRTSVEREWIRGDPAAREVLNEGPVAIYELESELDPGGCPAGAPTAFAAGST
jgi:hypothetical protein